MLSSCLRVSVKYTHTHTHSTPISTGIECCPRKCPTLWHVERGRKEEGLEHSQVSSSAAQKVIETLSFTERGVHTRFIGVPSPRDASSPLLLCCIFVIPANLLLVYLIILSEILISTPPLHSQPPCHFAKHCQYFHSKSEPHRNPHQLIDSKPFLLSSRLLCLYFPPCTSYS